MESIPIQRLAEAAEHSSLLSGQAVELVVRFLAQKTLAQSDATLRNRLEKGTGGDFNEPGKVCPRGSRTAFRKVGRNRHSGSAHLAGKPEALLVWEGPGQSVNRVGVFDGFTPHLQLLVIKHRTKEKRDVDQQSTNNSPHRLRSSQQTINYQPSTINRLPVSMVLRIERAVGGDATTEDLVLRFIAARYGARSLCYLPRVVADQVVRRPADFIRAAKQYCQPELAL